MNDPAFQICFRIVRRKLFFRDIIEVERAIKVYGISCWILSLFCTLITRIATYLSQAEGWGMKENKGFLFPAS